MSCSTTGDSLYDRQPVSRGQVTIAGCHRNRLVTRRFLNLFDRCASHCQPRAERVPVRVPDEPDDTRLFQARMEPGARVVALPLTGKDRVAWSKSGATKRFNRRDRI